jgi:hypothetical protein
MRAVGLTLLAQRYLEKKYNTPVPLQNYVMIFMVLGMMHGVLLVVIFALNRIYNTDRFAASSVPWILLLVINASDLVLNISFFIRSIMPYGFVECCYSSKGSFINMTVSGTMLLMCCLVLFEGFEGKEIGA